MADFCCPLFLLGVSTKKHKIGYPSTLAGITESAAKAIVAQQKSLDFLDAVVLDNKIALDYLSAEHRGVCLCCWVDNSGEAETQLRKIPE